MDDARALIAFGRKVREFRRAIGVSQDELAEAAQISRETVSNIERGVFFCTLPTLCRIAEFLKRNLDEFFVDTPRVKKSAESAAVDAAVVRFRDLLAAEKSLTVDDIASLLGAVGKAGRAKKPTKATSRDRSSKP